jgi:hypothetical protein
LASRCPFSAIAHRKRADYEFSTALVNLDIGADLISVPACLAPDGSLTTGRFYGQ